MLEHKHAESRGVKRGKKSSILWQFINNDQRLENLKNHKYEIYASSWAKTLNIINLRINGNDLRRKRLKIIFWVIIFK